MATAHFAPDEDFLEILCATARRGVEVQVLLPGPHADKRACQLASEAAYARLIECGVEVLTYQPSMMHQKVMIIDGYAVAIGSSNFNRRSLDHDEEVLLIALDRGLTATFDAHLEEDLRRSVPIDLTRWQQRGVPQRALEAATTPIRRWL